MNHSSRFFLKETWLSPNRRYVDHFKEFILEETCLIAGWCGDGEPGDPFSSLGEFSRTSPVKVKVRMAQSAKVLASLAAVLECKW